MFKIIVPYYNVSQWIGNCIKSIKLQDCEDYQCYLIDDMSTDNTNDIVEDLIADDERFKLIKNTEKKFALKNICDTIGDNDFIDDDIILVVDGDDWLATKTVLSKLKNVYDAEDCLMTYGSFINYPSKTRGAEASLYPENVIRENSYRKDRWRASHLRTFKYKVWKRVKHEDLKDTDGEYYEMTYDQAMMLPMLEMCGEKARYIDDVLYVYNTGNPNAVNKTRAQKQFRIMVDIRKKEPYNKVF